MLLLILRTRYVIINFIVSNTHIFQLSIRIRPHQLITAFWTIFIYHCSLGLIVELSALGRRFKVADRPFVNIVNVDILSLFLVCSRISWLVTGKILSSLSFVSFSVFELYFASLNRNYIDIVHDVLK